MGYKLVIVMFLKRGTHTFCFPHVFDTAFFFIFVGVAHYIPRKDPQYDWFCSSIL